MYIIGHHCLIGWMACATNFWHNVGLLAMPWERTIHWYLFIGSLKLIERTLKANLSQSWGCKGIGKKIFQIYYYFIISFMNVSTCMIFSRYQNTGYSTQFNYLCWSRRKLKRINMWSNHIYFSPIEGLFLNTVDILFMGCMHA